MNIPKFIDSVIVAVQGGIRTTESKFSPENIMDNFWECRSVQIESVYKKTSRINHVWTTQYYPDYDKALQDEKLLKAGATLNDLHFYRPVAGEGSEDGYKSRIGIHEVMQMTLTIKNLVMQSATADAIEKQAKADGMMTMLEDGIFKCVQGLTTIEEILRVTRE